MFPENIIVLALLFVIREVEAKYCAYEVNGDTRFYTCPRTEYCCNFGCCVSPAFQFYQLWYYWLLVIFMFLLCSGGGWWYRCWLRNRFPETQTSVTRTSTNNSMATSRRPAILTRSRPSSMAVPTVDNLTPQGGQFQVARVSYSSSGDRLILHRLWKDSRGGIHHLDSPPSYTTARADPVLVPQATGGLQLMNPYILYGPPPSYESVMQQDQAGPSGTHLQVAPLSEATSSLESCPSSQVHSPMTPTSHQEACSPTSEDDPGPQTSHQASQTVSSPVSSPTAL
ncbi:uncharacterized protein LOC135937625 [Cloeon dipterum]|uniref:uncharacterized protein LOC135937625 n=1 Tax=Cloeon dipterum TaxID=197152 RepID=UPI00321F6F2D